MTDGDGDAVRPLLGGSTPVIKERRYQVSDDERVTYESGPKPAEGDSLVAERESEPKSLRQRVQTALEIIRANPTGRIALKIVVAVVGAVVVLVGLALIPLPGPGWLLVIAGLGVWAIEYHWARRLLAFTRRNVQAWTRWAGRQSWPVRLLLGAVGLVFVSVVVWLSLKYSLGIDLVADVLHYLATH
ncbi:uncharacterized protein (TIGR02611 family) [Micromonospora pisi]|uniref:Uncharacterized protein (TIGR02611 family) n=1 Tax=Micromonospora pisi TaxID=589240 RepID=A0A495JS46_9ACTN|nr:TIGR02611 family protein [Micromonospora pisi]RKR91184.1 uncharacterized protein (TIGR02611 family) [Micromonospora pisi]